MIQLPLHSAIKVASYCLMKYSNSVSLRSPQRLLQIIFEVIRASLSVCFAAASTLKTLSKFRSSSLVLTSLPCSQLIQHTSIVQKSMMSMFKAVVQFFEMSSIVRALTHKSMLMTEPALASSVAFCKTLKRTCQILYLSLLTIRFLVGFLRTNLT